MQLLNVLSLFLLIPASVSLSHKVDAKDEVIALKEKTINYLGYQWDKTRTERDSAINVTFEYKEKFNIDERELENLKHVIATSKTGKVDTIYITQLVTDTVEIRKIDREYKRQVDSLKNRIRNIDSLKMSRRPVIGVRPKGI